MGLRSIRSFTLPGALLVLAMGQPACHLLYPFDLPALEVGVDLAPPLDLGLDDQSTGEGRPDAALDAALDTAPDLGKPDLGPTTTNKVWINEVTVTQQVTKIPIPDLGPSEGAFVLCTYLLKDSDPSKVPVCHLYTKELVIKTGSIAPTGLVVRYQVVRQSGVKVQRKLTTWSTGTAASSVPIQPVDRTRSFVIVTSSTSSSAASDDPMRLVAGWFNPTSPKLELQRKETGAEVHLAWQVVQLPTAKVQAGLAVIASGSTMLPPIALTSGAAATPLLFFSYNSPPCASCGYESSYLVRGYVDKGNLHFVRRAAPMQPIKIAWFAVEPGSGAQVETGFAQPTSGTSHPATLSAAVDLTRGVASYSANIEGSPNDDYQLDTASFIVRISSPTKLIFERGNTAGNTMPPHISWQVWQIPSTP